MLSVVTICIDRHAAQPWTTKEIFTSIQQKQKFYLPHFLNGFDLLKRYYKIYANKLTKLKTSAKKLYFLK